MTEPSEPLPGAVDNSAYRNLQDGFEGYFTPSPEDYRDALEHGIVVLDANTLLNLYRFDPNAREDLFAVLERISERLWMPYQVAREFWRNRDSSPAAFISETKKSLEQISAATQTVVSQVGALANRLSLAEGKKRTLIERLEKTFEAVQKDLSESSGSTDHLAYRDTSKDAILQRIMDLFHGRVGQALTESEVAEVTTEGKRRIDLKIPPGFEDAGKKSQLNGDYAVWWETLREAKKRKSNVIFVTGDMKEDWWRRVGNQTVGPRHELIDEMQDYAGVNAYFMTPQSLLVHARANLNVNVNESSVAGLDRIFDFVQGDMEQEEASRVDRLPLDLKAQIVSDSIRGVSVYISNPSNFDIKDLYIVPVSLDRDAFGGTLKSWLQASIGDQGFSSAKMPWSYVPLLPPGDWVIPLNINIKKEETIKFGVEVAYEDPWEGKWLLREESGKAYQSPRLSFSWGNLMDHVSTGVPVEPQKLFRYKD